MLHSFETLTVAIACPLKGGGSAFGTGFPVAPGLVLTAKHVIDPQNADGSPVRVRFWHATEREFAPDPDRGSNGFINAMAEPGSEGDAARGVIWSSEALDAALLKVPHPPSVRIATLARIEPYDNADWITKGFPEASWENNEPKPIRLTGKSHSRFPNSPYYQVDAEIAMTLDRRQRPNEPDGWSGASGAGLFVNGQIMGLLVIKRDNAGARVLKAVAIADLLADDGFRECIGLPPPACNPYTEALEKVFESLAPILRIEFGKRLALAPEAGPTNIAQALSNLSLQDGLALLEDLAELFEDPLIRQCALRFAACHCAPPNPEALRTAVFAREPDIESCAAGTKMGAEFLMAAAEARLPEFANVGDKLPPGRYVLPNLPETGTSDPDKALASDLEARIGADILATEAKLDEVMGPVCDFPMDSPQNIEIRREILREELSYRARNRKPQPSYYFAEPDPGVNRAAERTALTARINRIRESYPQIGAVYIRPEIAPKEFARFRPLVGLLPLETEND